MSDATGRVFELNRIDDVVTQLDVIVRWSKETESPLGYFASLYRQVTVAVRDRIREGGYFDDDQRMERLDVLFARRYIDAIQSWRDRRPTTESWQFAFSASKHWWPIVLQHLLLGINAHINLDLGIATALTAASPSDLPHLRGDFDRINDLLRSMVVGVEQQLATIWPMFRRLSTSLGDLDEGLVNFSIRRARDHAWRNAERFASLNPSAHPSEIARLDTHVVRLAHLVRYPGLSANFKLKLIRLGERGSVVSIIETLE